MSESSMLNIDQLTASSGRDALSACKDAAVLATVRETVVFEKERLD